MMTKCLRKTSKRVMSQTASVPDGWCFLAAWDVSTSAVAFKHDRMKPNLPKQRISTHSDVQQKSANQQTSFSGRGNAWIKLNFFRALCQKVPKTHYSSAEHRRPHCKQDERSSSPRYAV